MITTVLLIQETERSVISPGTMILPHKIMLQGGEGQCGVASSAQSTLISKNSLTFQALYLNKKI